MFAWFYRQMVGGGVGTSGAEGRASLGYEAFEQGCMEFLLSNSGNVSEIHQFWKKGKQSKTVKILDQAVSKAFSEECGKMINKEESKKLKKQFFGSFSQIDVLIRSIKIFGKI